MSAVSRIQRNKIAMVGSGMIGSVMAYLSGLKELGDVVLFDVVPNMPKGKALDCQHVTAVSDTSIDFVGASEFSSLEGADVVLVTAGVTKVPGKEDKEWSRDDLLLPCSKIIRQVGKAIKQYCPRAFVICITNPLDVMVKVLQEESGVPKHMICGMAGMLDSGRFRSYIADLLKVSPRDVQGTVIGAHGDSMIPLPRYCTVNGIPLQEFVNRGEVKQDDIDKIVERTKKSGIEIVQLLGHGSAFFAPATAAINMAKSYLRDEKRVIPSAVHLDGQYGVKDMFLGTPCVIGKDGIEKVIEMELDQGEKAELAKSIAEIQRLMETLKKQEAQESA